MNQNIFRDMAELSYQINTLEEAVKNNATLFLVICKRDGFRISNYDGKVEIYSPDGFKSDVLIFPEQKFKGSSRKILIELLEEKKMDFVQKQKLSKKQRKCRKDCICMELKTFIEKQKEKIIEIGNSVGRIEKTLERLDSYDEQRMLYVCDGYKTVGKIKVKHYREGLKTALKEKKEELNHSIDSYGNALKIVKDKDCDMRKHEKLEVTVNINYPGGKKELKSVIDLDEE